MLTVPVPSPIKGFSTSFAYFNLGADFPAFTSLANGWVRACVPACCVPQ